MHAAPTSRALQPYRLLFPFGLLYGAIGTGLWPVYALGGMAYPGALHRLLMIQGFEQSFVTGFLLTAMPGLTKGPPCQPNELRLAVGFALLFGVSAFLGAIRVAEVAFIAGLLLLLTAFARRSRGQNPARPVELWFVAFGLLLGLVGGVLQLRDEGANPFASRLLSLGMVLSLVLGLGGLLVPTFTGMRAPLEIAGVAAARSRRGRAALDAALILVLAAAFLAEATNHPLLGAYARALAASAVILLVWKLHRPPGRRDAPAIAMWSSGWFVLAGLWTAALAPALTLGALHVVFIGGFTFLTLGIGTRVVVSHGQYPLADERRVLSPLIVLSVVLALLARLFAAVMPMANALLLGVSGALWLLGWLAWGWQALPRLLQLERTRV
jgi:uncharacterized protein involved in response to NO